MEACERVFVADPEPAPSLLNRYAVAFDMLGEHERARAVLRRALETRPGSHQLLFNLAYSYDLECRMTEAREAYRAAVTADPGDVKARVGLVNIAAGGNPDCERCRAALAADATLRDDVEVERQLLEVVRRDRGTSPWLTDEIARTFDRTGVFPSVLDALREVIADADVDERVVRIERFLRGYSDR